MTQPANLDPEIVWHGHVFQRVTLLATKYKPHPVAHNGCQSFSNTAQNLYSQRHC